MDDLISTADIATMAKCSRPYVTDKLVKRVDFPKPAVDVSQKMRRWRRADVERWLTRDHSRLAMSAADSR